MRWLRTTKRRPRHPDDVRMSFGEHLEELRTRIIRLLLGAVVGMAVCFVFSDTLMKWLLKPLYVALAYNGLPPQIIAINPIESFMVVMKVSIYCGLILTAPWCLYQLWAFVAAGLYEHEQYWVKKFFPASVILFFTGVAFCFTVILPLAFTFLLSIRSWIPAPQGQENFVTSLVLGRRLHSSGSPGPASRPVPTSLPALEHDPEKPTEGQVWVDVAQRRLKIFADGKILTVPLTVQQIDSFVLPQFTLDETVSFITNLALGFGIGFQIPIVVVLLAMLHVVSVPTMTRAWRYVILIIIVVAAVVTPTPDITSQMLLAVPMCLLYWAGLVAARIIIRRREKAGYIIGDD
jgi:Tat protein translocase TatC